MLFRSVPAPTAPESGPRLRREWRRVEPRVSITAVSEIETPTSLHATHTIRVTTLVLVLAVVILVLLVA